MVLRVKFLIQNLLENDTECIFMDELSINRKIYEQHSWRRVKGKFRVFRIYEIENYWYIVELLQLCYYCILTEKINW